MPERSNDSPGLTDQSQPIHILLVEDEPDLRTTLRYNFKQNAYKVTTCVNGKEALELLKSLQDEESETPVELIVSDVMMPVMDGIEMARQLRQLAAYKETPLMFLTAKGQTEDRLEGFRVGADDYLTKPFDLEELLARIHVQARRAASARRVRALLEDSAPQSQSVRRHGDLYAKVAIWEQRFPQLAAIRRDSIVGQSERMLSLLREVLMRAPGKDPVLIVGETGTGKTGVAEALYQLGPRADGPFRVVNCAELSAADAAITLGKLFGYGKGSGLANVPKEGQPGLLEDVDGGTLFLDEIHRLPLEAQAMLLLPIEGRPFHPAVGKGAPRCVDVKFLFATNVDLEHESAENRFPFDLYQRLSASQIRVPSLADRKRDIPALAGHFLDECREEFDLPGATFAPSLLQHLKTRTWPGNVRELRATVREVVRRAAFEFDTLLTTEHLPESAAALEQGSDAALSLQSASSLSGGSNLETDSEQAESITEPPRIVPGANDDGDGFWNEQEMLELSALRRHRFKIAQAELELGMSSKSRTLTNHLRGMCFKALVHQDFDLESSARLVVGREDEALHDRTLDRLQGYLNMVERHTRTHTTKTLFNNLPRDYRKFVEASIDRARHF